MKLWILKCIAKFFLKTCSQNKMPVEIQQNNNSHKLDLKLN